MSSTWFKSLSALKVEIDWHGTGFTYTNYVLIAETAESNVVNNNGGHSYHKWIYACGEYDEIMRKVCRGACDFDNGMAKWKPNHKDSVGFIRMVKKHLTKQPKQLNSLIILLDMFISEVGFMIGSLNFLKMLKALKRKSFMAKMYLLQKILKLIFDIRRKLKI